MIEASPYSNVYPIMRRSAKILREREIVQTPEKGALKICRYRPDGTVDGSTILIANGWGEGTRVLDIAAKTLAGTGRQVVTFDHLRTSEARANPEDYKASTLEAVYNHVCIDDEDTVIAAHSEGAISTMKMLKKRAGSKGNLLLPPSVVLAAPAGFIGPDDWTQLLKRAITKEATQTVKHCLVPLGGVAVQAAVESVRQQYLLRNLQLGIIEAQEIAETDLVPDTLELSKRKINFTILACLQDGIFPYEPMYRHTQPLRDAKAVDWEEADVYHHEFLANPKVLAKVNDYLT